MKSTIILNNQQIEHIIKRIAYQIYELNSKEKEIVIAGVANNGFIFAKQISKVIENISPIKVLLCKVIIDKKKPREAIKTSLSAKTYINKSVLLIDDVLNSGTTLMYCVKHFLEVPLKQFKTVVLVNRNHKKYPIKADFKGISLSTSLQEHIVVEFKKNNAVAFLK